MWTGLAIILGISVFGLICWGLFVLLTGRSFLPQNAALPTLNNKKGFWFLVTVGAVALAVAVWWYWSAIMGLSFFWKLVACAVPIFFGWRLSKGLKFSLATNLFWGGAIAMLAVVLFSNFGEVTEQAVNLAEEKVGQVDVSNLSVDCPGTFSTGEAIVVRRGCTTELNSPNGTNFRAKNGRFDGLLTQYVDIEQPYAGFYTLKPNQGFPDGVPEVWVTTIPPT